MLIIVFIASILASALNAGSSVYEREAAGTPNVKELFTRRLSLSVGRNKKFLAGVTLQLMASALEIVALKNGTLEIVAPLLTLDLVFLLIFLSRRHNLKIRWQNWAAVIAVVSGLSLLFICTRPHGDHIRFDGLKWLITLSTIGLVILASIVAVPKLKSPKTRAGVLAISTAACYGLNAGLVKLALNQFASGGFHNLIVSWPLYVLLASAALSLYLTQNTFSAGPLVISQPIIEIVQPLVSVAIGIFIFQDDIRNSALAIVGDCFAILILVLGIITLARNDNLFSEGSKKKTI
jgi:hypothetical protein